MMLMESRRGCPRTSARLCVLIRAMLFENEGATRGVMSAEGGHKGASMLVVYMHTQVSWHAFIGHERDNWRIGHDMSVQHSSNRLYFSVTVSLQEAGNSDWRATGNLCDGAEARWELWWGRRSARNGHGSAECCPSPPWL